MTSLEALRIIASGEISDRLALRAAPLLADALLGFYGEGDTSKALTELVEVIVKVGA